MDAEDPQNLILCCCVCSQEEIGAHSPRSSSSQHLTHPYNSRHSLGEHSLLHPTNSCLRSQEQVHSHSRSSCTCIQEHSHLHSNVTSKTPFKVSVVETNSESSQCFCALLPGWRQTPIHNGQAPCLIPGRCHKCHDSCHRIRAGKTRGAICIACAQRSKNSVWNDCRNCQWLETDVEESDISDSEANIGWTLPEGMLATTDCAVCLEGYNYGSVLCGLPCGHNYHQRCILAWLQRDNHHCPVCRWPAYRTKAQRIHLHQE